MKTCFLYIKRANRHKARGAILCLAIIILSVHVHTPVHGTASAVSVSPTISGWERSPDVFFPKPERRRMIAL